MTSGRSFLGMMAGAVVAPKVPQLTEPALNPEWVNATCWASNGGWVICNGHSIPEYAKNFRRFKPNGISMEEAWEKCLPMFEEIPKYL